MAFSILITGGTGFVGKHLVQLLLKQSGISIAVLSSGRNFAADSQVHHYQADLRNGDHVAGIVREVNPTHVYHLAAVSAIDASWSDPKLTYEINFWGARNVFEAAVKLPSAARILNVSTSQVYGRSRDRLTESSPVAPESPYAASKAMSEFLRIEFGSFSSGGVVTARPFNHSGPGQSPNFVLAAMAKQFAEMSLGLSPPKLSVGNVAVKRDFTDVRDVVVAYALLMEKGRVGDIYNVCSGSTVSLSDVIKMFEAASNIRVDVVSSPNKIRPGEADEICGDPRKITSDTGWSPKISLQKTIVDLLDYWRSLLGPRPSAVLTGL